MTVPIKPERLRIREIPISSNTVHVRRLKTLRVNAEFSFRHAHNGIGYYAAARTLRYAAKRFGYKISAVHPYGYPSRVLTVLRVK